jgi:hypothetical protein
MLKFPGMLDEISQQRSLILERKAQPMAALQIKGHGLFEWTRFHRRTSPGQGWATARSIGKLTLA